MGDRECPACGKESLIEKSLTTWVCLNEKCRETYESEDLDADIEEFD